MKSGEMHPGGLAPAMLGSFSNSSRNCSRKKQRRSLSTMRHARRNGSFRVRQAVLIRLTLTLPLACEFSAQFAPDLR